MISSLAFAPEFPRSVARFEAWWRGEMLDRPPVSLHAKRTRRYEGPVAQHANMRDRWLDCEFVVRSAIAWMACCDFVGDTLPVFWANVGPEITATLFGCELDFSKDSSWSRPIVQEAEQWEQVIAKPANFDNPYWQAVEKMTDLALELAQGRYLVGVTDLHGNYDILAALRDPQTLCMDMVDCPELIDRACKHVSDGFNQAFARSYKKLKAAGMGSTCWSEFYHAGPAFIPSSDFWCMVSPEHAEGLVLPRIVQEMELLERSIFHLDGPQALRHLDLLLKLPQLNAVQWVCGAGRGPAAKWLDVYKRIRAAGKSIQVMAEDMGDAMAVLKEIGPRGLWLTIGEPAESVRQAEEYLRDVERICKCK